MKKKFPPHLNNAGFGLTEVLMGAALLGVAAIMGLTLFSNIFKSTVLVEEQGRVSQVMGAIESDIYQNQKYYPPIPPASAPAGNLFDPAVNLNYLEQRCYDANGNKTASSPGAASWTDGNCCYGIAFYKEWVMDQTFASDAQMAFIPVTRVNIQLTYPMKNAGCTLQTPTKHVLVVNRLFTQTLVQ